jgi:hypothetical protein
MHGLHVQENAAFILAQIRGELQSGGIIGGASISVLHPFMCIIQVSTIIADLLA